MRTLSPPRFYYGWVMVAAAFAINAVSATLNPVVFSFLIGPISDDLGADRSAVAWSFTLRLVAAGLMGPVMGVLIDRYGTRVLGAAAGAIAGVTLFLLGFAHDLWLIYLIFAVSGIAGLGGPAGQLITQVPIAKWFVVRRGRALSIATIGLAAGTVVFVMITGLLVEAIGWRGTTGAFGILVAAVVVPVSVIFVRRNPEDMGLHPDGAAHPAATRAPETPTRASRLTTHEDWTVREALRTPAMWLLLGAMVLSGLALTGTLVYRTDFWRGTGMSPGLVAAGTALDPLILIFALFAAGFVADRVPIRYLGVFGLLGFAASIVPMIVSTGQASTIVAHNLIWGIAASGNITLHSMVWPNYYGRGHLGSIRGIVLPVMIAAQGLGAPLFGYLLEAGLDTSYVWTISSVAFALSACLVYFARPPGMRRPPIRTPAMAESPAG